MDRWRGFGQAYILGDGAAAALVSDEGGFAEVRSLNSGVLHELEKWHRGDGPLILREDAYSMSDMAERAQRFTDREMPLSETMEKLTLFDLEIIQRSLVDAGINASDLAMVVPINMDGRMIEYSIMMPLGLTMERCSWDFGRAVGHVGGADVFITLEHLVRTRAVSPGDHVLLVSQGAGLAVQRGRGHRHGGAALGGVTAPRARGPAPLGRRTRQGPRPLLVRVADLGVRAGRPRLPLRARRASTRAGAGAHKRWGLAPSDAVAHGPHLVRVAGQSAWPSIAVGPRPVGCRTTRSATLLVRVAGLAVPAGRPRRPLLPDPRPPRPGRTRGAVGRVRRRGRSASCRWPRRWSGRSPPSW